MAIIYNCAQDWTYDQYVQDVETYDVSDSDNILYNAYFVAMIKKSAKNFLNRWIAEHSGKLYDGTWVGDEFAINFMNWFSDFYKDTYGQRPHLPIWYYIHPLGLPMKEDSIRSFCARPIEDACNAARTCRETIEKEDYIANLDDE